MGIPGVKVIARGEFGDVFDEPRLKPGGEQLRLRSQPPRHRRARRSIAGNGGEHPAAPPEDHVTLADHAPYHRHRFVEARADWLVELHHREHDSSSGVCHPCLHLGSPKTASGRPRPGAGVAALRVGLSSAAL